MLRLKEIREKQGLKQKYVAEKLGVSRFTMNRWENNTRLPNAEQMKMLADFYKVKVDQLYEKR